MFENIWKFFKNIGKKEEAQKNANSKEAAKERLHLVLMQDRANVSADFLEMMKQEIIEVIKKYIEVDETAIDVRLTNQKNDDETNGAPALYANIPILNIKNEARKIDKEDIDSKKEEIEQKNNQDNQKNENKEKSEKKEAKENPEQNSKKEENGNKNENQKQYKNKDNISKEKKNLTEKRENIQKVSENKQLSNGKNAEKPSKVSEAQNSQRKEIKKEEAISKISKEKVKSEI